MKVALETQDDELVEDILQITRGTVTLDIGWYPEGDPTGGEFRCVVVRDKRWKEPSEELRTKDPIHAMGWANTMAVRYGLTDNVKMSKER